VLPAEAGLDERAISFTKGCYPGQEPVARLRHRGHPNRRLGVLEIEAEEPPAYDAEILHGDRVVGRVTSAVPDDGRVVALGYVRTDVPEDAELCVAGALARMRPA
jgi:folate-binding Fe-S cluster repair protein YgfZ